MRAEHAARIRAIEANPLSTVARGKFAVFLHANDYLTEAAALYEDLRQNDPTEARWSYYLARIVQDEGPSDRARTLLDEAATRAPGYPLIWLRKADLLLKSGEPQDAEAAYRKYLTQVPGSAHARLGLARLAMQNQDWKRAETLLLETLQHEPDFPSGRALLVSVFEALGKADKAAQAREQAGDAHRYREPDDPWLNELVDHCFDVEKLSVLADVALEAGRVARSIELLERSRTIEPARARTHLELGKAKLKANDRAAATSLFSEAIRLDASLADAHYTLVGELQGAGDLPRAMSAADVGLRHNPQNAGLHRQRGTLLQAAGRHEEAEATLQRAVSLDSADAKNVEALGNFYWSAGRKELAVDQFERARDLSRLTVKPRAILGGYYLEADRLPEAERCIAEAYEIEPGLEGLDELRALVQVRRGNTRFRAGDAAGAEAAFRLALNAKPDHEESLTNLVAVMLRTRRGSEARALLSTFIAEHPRATFAYSLASRVAAQMDDRPAALELASRGLDVAHEQNDLNQEQALRTLLLRLRAP